MYSYTEKVIKYINTTTAISYISCVILFFATIQNLFITQNFMKVSTLPLKEKLDWSIWCIEGTKFQIYILFSFFIRSIVLHLKKKTIIFAAHSLLTINTYLLINYFVWSDGTLALLNDRVDLTNFFLIGSSSITTYIMITTIFINVLWELCLFLIYSLSKKTDRK